MLYTSGTTADPKGVVLTHANLDAERAALAVIARATATRFSACCRSFTRWRRWPTCCSRCRSARASSFSSPELVSLLEALAVRGITIFACVRQFFYLIHQRVMASSRSAARRVGIFRALLASNRPARPARLEPGPPRFARVHRVLGPQHASSRHRRVAFDAPIGRDLYDMGFTLLNAYGLTETSGAATVMRPGDASRRRSVIRCPASRCASARAESEGDGEILIRGPIVMREYFGRPDATAEAIVPDGWLHTGDLGPLDEAGRCTSPAARKRSSSSARARISTLRKSRRTTGIRRSSRSSACWGSRSRASRRPSGCTPSSCRTTTRCGRRARQHRRRDPLRGRDWSASLPAHKRILGYDICPTRCRARRLASSGGMRSKSRRSRARRRRRPRPPIARSRTPTARGSTTRGTRRWWRRSRTGSRSRACIPPPISNSTSAWTRWNASSC